MSTPLVSVVLPFRNAEATLLEAVECVLHQTLVDFELIAVDDGSTDDSRALLRGLADPRIRIFPAEGQGIVAALNTGIDRCRAPWIARMDADDRCTPDRLEAQLHYADQHPDVAVVGALVEAFPVADLTPGMRHYLDWMNGLISPSDIAREIYVESPIAHPSAFIRRDVLTAAGGYQEGDFPEDYDLWLRLHAKGVRFGKVNRVLLHWREGPDRLSRTDPRYRPESFRRRKARALTESWLAEGSPVQIWGAGPDGKRWARALEALGVRVERFFDIDPKKIGGQVAGRIPVLDAESVGSYRGVPLLGAVGVKGARALIRERLASQGWQEGIDHVFVQ